jgi:hypothetical protein
MVDVIAVGTAVSSKLGNLSQVMEEAMVAAIHRCYAEGKTDVESILEAKAKALEEIKRKFQG